MLKRKKAWSFDLFFTNDNELDEWKVMKTRNGAGGFWISQGLNLKNKV